MSEQPYQIIRREAVKSGVTTAAINVLMNWFKFGGRTLHPLTFDNISATEYSVFGSAGPASFFVCAILGTFVFFTFRKKAKLQQLAPNALLDRPFFFFGIKTVLFYTFFLFGMVITAAIFWQRFFGTVLVNRVTATLCLSLISGLASLFINASTMRAMLRPE